MAEDYAGRKSKTAGVFEETQKVKKSKMKLKKWSL